jgi:NADH-quinone oxidoreductase subunit M
LGLFALNGAGITGGVLQMVNHGLSTGALFLLVGMVYDRYHTRQLDDLGGLAARLPLLTTIMVFVAMASIGLPGLNGFVGEVLSLGGMFRHNPLHAILGTSGVVLGAWYLLTMVQQAFFGPLHEPANVHGPIKDINLRELAAVVPICVLCIWIGVMPQPLINTIRPDVDAVVQVYEEYLTGSERVAEAKVDRPSASTDSAAGVHHASQPLVSLKSPAVNPEL